MRLQGRRGGSYRALRERQGTTLAQQFLRSQTLQVKPSGEARNRRGHVTAPPASRAAPVPAPLASRGLFHPCHGGGRSCRRRAERLVASIAAVSGRERPLTAHRLLSRKGKREAVSSGRRSPLPRPFLVVSSAPPPPGRSRDRRALPRGGLVGGGAAGGRRAGRSSARRSFLLDA